MSDAVKRAKANYRAKFLKNMNLQFSRHDTESYAALCELEKIYGSAAGAVKQALIAHAKAVKEQS